MSQWWLFPKSITCVGTVTRKYEGSTSNVQEANKCSAGFAKQKNVLPVLAESLDKI